MAIGANLTKRDQMMISAMVRRSHLQAHTATSFTCRARAARGDADTSRSDEQGESRSRRRKRREDEDPAAPNTGGELKVSAGRADYQ